MDKTNKALEQKYHTLLPCWFFVHNNFFQKYTKKIALVGPKHWTSRIYNPLVPKLRKKGKKKRKEGNHPRNLILSS